MLKGMATNQARAVREDVGTILYYVPVVDPAEFDVAISYLVRRLEESAAEENFMSGVFDFPHDVSVFERERQRYVTALLGAFPQADEQLRKVLPIEGIGEVPELSFGPRRIQDRRVDDVELVTSFHNVADSDPSLPANVSWASSIFQRMATDDLGTQLADSARVHTEEEVVERISQARDAAQSWADRPAHERASILRKAGKIIGQRRADFITVAGNECGKILHEGDIEVSEAIDFVITMQILPKS